MKQIGESKGVLADRVYEGERNPLPSTEFSHLLHRSIDEIDEILELDTKFLVLGSEIPDGFNHQSNGNSISFMVGQNWRYPYPFAVCIAFAPTNGCSFPVEVEVNGCSGICYADVFLQKSESCHLWIFSTPLCAWEKELRDSNLSKQGHFEVICKITKPVIKRWGVHVECICCPRKSFVLDSNASVRDPPQVPDTSNGSNFVLGQIDLVGSTISGGFDLGSSSMTHEFVNDDFDLNLSPPSKKKGTS